MVWTVVREKATGRKLVVFASHFWWQEKGVADDYLRLLNARMLHEAVSGVAKRHGAAVVGGGDLNSPVTSSALAELKKLGLVRQEPYGDLELSSEGVKVAAEILGRHTLLRRFLMKLGVSRDTAEEDACRMEHILSAETYDRIHAFLGDEP